MRPPEKPRLLERCISLIAAKHDDDFVYELPYGTACVFRVLQGYGGEYSHTDRSYYSLDFKMPKDTPVCSARSGVVWEANNSYCDGGTDPVHRGKDNKVAILHDDGTIAWYRHLNKTGVSPGQHVMTGKVIGWSGSTGWSSCPHLHFEVCGSHGALATKFRTIEGSGIYLKVGKLYTRPSDLSTWRVRMALFMAKCIQALRPTR